MNPVQYFEPSTATFGTSFSSSLGGLDNSAISSCVNVGFSFKSALFFQILIKLSLPDTKYHPKTRHKLRNYRAGNRTLPCANWETRDARNRGHVCKHGFPFRDLWKKLKTSSSQKIQHCCLNLMILPWKYFPQMRQQYTFICESDTLHNFSKSKSNVARLIVSK